MRKATISCSQNRADSPPEGLSGRAGKVRRRVRPSTSSTAPLLVMRTCCSKSNASNSGLYRCLLDGQKMGQRRRIGCALPQRARAQSYGGAEAILRIHCGGSASFRSPCANNWTRLASCPVRQPPAKVNGSLGIISKKTYATPTRPARPLSQSPRVWTCVSYLLAFIYVKNALLVKLVLLVAPRRSVVSASGDRHWLNHGSVRVNRHFAIIASAARPTLLRART